MAFKTLDDIDLAGKRVLIRVDLNVPMQNGSVSDATRIERIKPTINDVTAAGGKAILLAHFGRPKGVVVPDMSLGPIVSAVSDTFGKSVAFADACIGDKASSAISAMNNGDILLLENTRFHADEEKNSPEFAKQLADLGDVFVADAFSASHRAHASTVGIADHLPTVAGRTMQQEVEALDAALSNPKRPVMAVVGGAKVSTKIDLLENLLAKVDILVIGGGMANTFLAAKGVDVGKSLCEHDLAETATRIMNAAAGNECEIILPEDVVVAKEFAANAENRTCGANDVASDEMILDAGAATVKAVEAALDKAETLVWNGPLGAFEITPFDTATVAAAQYAATQSKQGSLMSIAGGGDTVAALNHAGVAADFSYISTAGGAFLEWLEGKALPGVEILRK